VEDDCQKRERVAPVVPKKKDYTRKGDTARHPKKARIAAGGRWKSARWPERRGGGRGEKSPRKERARFI